MTALSLLAVHLTERLKLILIYTIVYGLISGVVLSSLALKFGLSLKRHLLVLILILTISGQCLVLYLSYQRYQQATRKGFQSDKTTMVIERMFATGEPPEDPQARQEYEKVLQQFEAAKKDRKAKEQRLLELSSYLQHRISPVAQLSAPWPLLFWIFELILCCLAALWACKQVALAHTPDAQASDQGSAES